MPVAHFFVDEEDVDSLVEMLALFRFIDPDVVPKLVSSYFQIVLSMHTDPTFTHLFLSLSYI